ncbi:class B sortase, partial [Eggerthella lenta]
NDGTMFSALACFSDAGYAEGHSPIILQTPEGDAGLRVLAVDVVDAGREGAKVEFTDDAEHAQWLARVVADADLSLVGEGFDFSSVKSVVTLCTCSYNRWGNERTLVICAVDALG